MIDVVIPKGNIQEFVDMANRLGYKSLCIIGGKSNIADHGMKIHFAKPKFIHKTLDARAALERLHPDIIYGLEEGTRADMIHQRNAGLNHITCKMAAAIGTSVGFSFSSLLDLRNRTRIIGRMAQNIKLCRKYGVKMLIASFATDPMQMRAPEELQSLFRTIGMTQTESKQALVTADYYVNKAIKKKQGKFITSGAEYV